MFQRKSSYFLSALSVTGHRDASIRKVVLFYSQYYKEIFAILSSGIRKYKA